MDIFNALSLIGGLCLFLFGMNLMGQALERRAGGKLRNILEKLTTRKIIGLLTGLGITAVIQSSSATTVMVVGFVNSGLMTLTQAINVIMGANIGTTVTAWILSLGGIESTNIFVQLLKPTSFTPILALIGTIFYMFGGNGKKQDTGTILLGFATLMFGMDAMSNSVKGLADVPQFQNMFIMFKNPILGILVGAVLTGIIQSSSASVGILQALSATGQVSYGAAIPIIMGQNIGTCVTALLSSFGTNRNAKRAAFVHLFFNIIGTVILTAVFCVVKALFQPVLFDLPTSYMGIAIAHSSFNIVCTILLYPLSGLLELLVKKLVPDAKVAEKMPVLDDRLLSTPPVALELCRKTAVDMANSAVNALEMSLSAFDSYGAESARKIREIENKIDCYEDILGTYLVKLSGKPVSADENTEIAELLKVIGDFERISDHSVNLLCSAEELRDKKIEFTPSAKTELDTIFAAVREILGISLNSFVAKDTALAVNVEPLEQVIDKLRVILRSRHILRLQKGECTIEAGFIWLDILTNLARTSDHCSNIAGSVIDRANNNMNMHETLRSTRDNDPVFGEKYRSYKEKYALR